MTFLWRLKGYWIIAKKAGRASLFRLKVFFRRMGG